MSPHSQYYTPIYKNTSYERYVASNEKKIIQERRNNINKKISRM